MKTHWKKIHNPNYLGSYSLADNDGKYADLIVQLKSVGKEEVTGEDGKEAEKIVAQVHNNKPLIINATNAKMLTKLFNSPFVEDWLNKPITLTVKKIRAFGETVDALRIVGTLPAAAPAKTKPELSPGHEKWDGAKDALTKGTTTIEAIRKGYELSEANELLLTTPERQDVTQ